MKKIIKTLLFVILLIVVVIAFSNVSKAEDEIQDISTLTEFTSYATNGGHVRLQGDITITANTFVRQPLVLDLNGHTINLQGKTLVPYAELTINDTSDSKAGLITGTGSFKIQVGGSTTPGTLVMNAGTIEGNTKYGVRIVNGTFTQNGGTIQSDGYPIYNESKYIINGGLALARKNLTVQNKQNSTFEMNGGTIKTEADYQAINFYGDCSGVINGGEVLAPKEGTRYTGDGIAAFKNTEVTINGGTISAYGNALLGNGSVSGSNEGTNAKFTINGGTLISTSAMAIYAPQPEGVTIINGGTLKGKTGIEVRAGTLIVNGGTIEGDKTELNITANTNGGNIYGTGISVVQHNTKLPIDVQIKGGQISGYSALMEKNTLGNSQSDVEKIKISISNGDLTSVNDTPVNVEDYAEPFITGGKYSNFVTNYVKDGYGEKAENNKIAVYKFVTVKANQETNGSITIKRNATKLDNGTVVTQEVTSNNELQALYGDKIEITVNPQNNYSLLAIKETEEGTAGKIISTDSINCGTLNIEIDAKFAKAVVDEVAENANDTRPAIKRTTEEDSAKTAIFDQLKNNEPIAQDINSNEDLIVKLIIKEKELNDSDKEKILAKMKADTTIVQLYDIYISIEDSNGNEISRIHEIPNDISFEVNIPNELAAVPEGKTRTYTILRDHNDYQIIENTLSADGKTVSFKSNKFSTFALVYDEVEEEKPATGNTEENNEVPPADENEDETIPEGELSLPITGPITGDNIAVWASVCGITFATLIIVIRKNKNRKYFNIL